MKDPRHTHSPTRELSPLCEPWTLWGDEASPWFRNRNKCPTWGGRETVHVGAEGVWEIFVLGPQCCCNLELLFKN